MNLFVKREIIRYGFIVTALYLWLIYGLTAIFYFSWVAIVLLLNFLFFHLAPNFTMIILIYFILAAVIAIAGSFLAIIAPDCWVLRLFDAPSVRAALNKYFTIMAVQNALIKEAEEEEENQ